jgi:hypothetical protein
MPVSCQQELIELSEIQHWSGPVQCSEPIGEFRRRPESEQFFRLAKTAKQAMLVLSSIQPDAGRRTTAAALIRQYIKQFKKKGRSKPDRVLRQAPSFHEQKSKLQGKRYSFFSFIEKNGPRPMSAIAAKTLHGGKATACLITAVRSPDETPKNMRQIGKNHGAICALLDYAGL